MMYTAVVTEAPGRNVAEERPVPPPRPGTVLGEVLVAGICGSDLAINRGPFPGRIELPRVLGHEVVARVRAIGPGVTGWSVGDRVVPEEILWCGRCRACRAGEPDLCATAEEIGFTVDGGFAELIELPATHLHPVPTGVPDVVAALVEPLAVAYNGVVLRGDARVGENVVVAGLGPIGLGAALWARASGAVVGCVDRDPARVALAEHLGFAAGCVDGAMHGAVDELLGGRRADLVVEAAGDHGVVAASLASLAPAGRIVLLGHSTRATTVELEDLVLRGARVQGSCGQVGRNTYERVLNALEHGVVDPRPLVSATIGLDEAPAVLDAARPAVGKVHVAVAANA